MVDRTGRSAAITAVVMTATFDDEAAVVVAEDDDIEPTIEPSTVVAEVVTPGCLFAATEVPPFPALRLPPVDGFSPNIHTRCYEKKNRHKGIVELNLYCNYNGEYHHYIYIF